MSCPKCPCAECVAARSGGSRRNALIAIKDVERVPGWPHSAWVTTKLIRDGKLGKVSHGRRFYVTEEILQMYIEQNTTVPR